MLCARSMEPFERSRSWFAADAGLMQIQLWEGAVWRCTGALRESTTAGAGGEKTGMDVRDKQSRMRNDPVCRTTRQRETERADARKGLGLERVDSCGSNDQSGRRTKLDFGSSKSFDEHHRSTTLGAESRMGGVIGGRWLLPGLRRRVEQVKTKGQE